MQDIPKPSWIPAAHPVSPVPAVTSRRLSAVTSPSGELTTPAGTAGLYADVGCDAPEDSGVRIPSVAGTISILGGDAGGAGSGG